MRQRSGYLLLFTVWAALVSAIWLVPGEPALADNYNLVSGSATWEASAPGANTDAITDITWSGAHGLRLTIQCDTATVVNLMVTRSSTENALGLNSNTALTAGAVFTFDVYGLEKDDTVNVQVETNSAIPMLSIGELRKVR